MNLIIYSNREIVNMDDIYRFVIKASSPILREIGCVAAFRRASRRVFAFSLHTLERDWFWCVKCDCAVQIEISTGYFPYKAWDSVFDQLQQVVHGSPPKLEDIPNKISFSTHLHSFIQQWLESLFIH